MGTGTSGATEAPPIVAEPAPATDDHALVAAVRRGDDRAFEALYARYQRRIHAYVVGMVKDHGRAEDVTQDVFMSALRRMRETERPIAFKPWIYEIARNACIDHFRRSRRADEVSIDGGEGLAPADYGRLAGAGPTPDAAVAVKQELNHLRGALDEVSETHLEILVLRELEGLSYSEIGDRMGMSRPAVESTLFRARRRLSEEYDELVTGARCRRVQGLIETAAESRLGTREGSRLSRHLAHCQGCRRAAAQAGLDPAFFTHVPLRRRVAERVAGLLPFPLLGRGRSAGGDAAGAATSHAGGGANGWLGQLPFLSEQAAAPWAKAAAVAAMVVAGAGATGVGTHGPRDSAAAARPPAAAEERSANAGRKAAATLPAAARTPLSAPRSTDRERGAADTISRPARRTDRRSGERPTAPRTERPAADDRTPRTAPGTPAPAEERSTDRDDTTAAAPKPRPKADDGAGTKPDPVEAVTDRGDEATNRVGDTVNRTVEPVVETVNKTVEPVVDTVNKVVEPVTQTVDKVVDPVLNAPVVRKVTEPVKEIVDPVVQPVVDKVVKPVTDGLERTTGLKLP